MTDRRPGAFGLSLDPDELLPPDRYPFGLSDGRAGRVGALARALASSPVWAPMEEAILVARTEPPEGIAFLGFFTEEEASFLEWLPGQLEGALPRLRYLSWAEAEAAVEELAARLVERFGPDEVRGMDYLGIPRGGLIVLGMLSYALGLSAARMKGPTGEGRPLILVDDCALTGLRFGGHLKGLPETTGGVIFAHLFSHPDLRAAIEARHPEVAAVLAARDLSDAAPELEGEGVVAWRARWRERTGEAAYWIGRTEHLAFPWSEPDLTLWDPRSAREVAGWRIVPPEACMKNRFSGTGRPLRLQFQPRSRGPIRPGARTFYGEQGERVLAADLGSGRAIALDGVAADMWRAVMQHGSVEPAVTELAREYRVDPDRLLADFRSLIGKLTEEGFVATEGPGSQAEDPTVPGGTEESDGRGALSRGSL